MATPPNISNGFQTSPNRNHTVNFNYVWDEVNEYWTPQKGSSLNYDSVVGRAKDYIHKFGSNPDVSNTISTSSPETIWDGSENYTFPPDLGTGIQIKSSQATDSQEFIVEGLDENFENQYWTGNLNGANDVNIDGTWSRVFRAYNNGTSGIAGNIDIHANGDASTVYAKVLSGNDQTLMAVYTVPATCTGYMLGYHMSAHNPSSASEIGYTAQVKTREYGKVFRVQEVTSVTTSAFAQNAYPFPLELPPKTDVIVDAVSANGNNGAVDADFDIALLY
jgi:hypothetical protein